MAYRALARDILQFEPPFDQPWVIRARKRGDVLWRYHTMGNAGDIIYALRYWNYESVRTHAEWLGNDNPAMEYDIVTLHEVDVLGQNAWSYKRKKKAHAE